MNLVKESPIWTFMKHMIPFLDTRIQMLHQISGSILGTTAAERSSFLVGKTRCGKSTLISTLATIMGDSHIKRINQSETTPRRDKRLLCDVGSKSIVAIEFFFFQNSHTQASSSDRTKMRTSPMIWDTDTLHHLTSRGHVL